MKAEDYFHPKTFAVYKYLRGVKLIDVGEYPDISVSVRGFTYRERVEAWEKRSAACAKQIDRAARRVIALAAGRDLLQIRLDICGFMQCENGRIRSHRLLCNVIDICERARELEGK